MSLLALLDCSTILLSAAILAAPRGVAEAIDDATRLFFFADAELLPMSMVPSEAIEGLSPLRTLKSSISAEGPRGDVLPVEVPVKPICARPRAELRDLPLPL
eukprot:jgi/Chrpa1/22691/Chrysochromulina_OHIO_Genome00022416-RA